MQVQRIESGKVTLSSDVYRIDFEKSEDWKQFLQQNGFVVIKNYLLRKACQKYVEQFWDIMQFLADGRLDRNKPQTQILGKNYPSVLHGGMIQYIGHSKPQWQLRRQCKPIFQKLWDQNNVKTSFDGFCFMNGKRNYKARQDNAFLHVDQSPIKNFIWSYQGVMTLTDADDNGGGFVCAPKSHKFHHSYFEKKKMLAHKDNWFLIPEQDKSLKQLKTLKVNSKAGDFILFDSRTFHCNTVPTNKTLRICSYVCMLPFSKVPKQIQKKRKQAIKEKRTTNHHPGDGFKMFPVTPRFLEDRDKFLENIHKVNSYELGKSDIQMI